MTNPRGNLIYKVVSSDQWARAEAKGVFEGAEVDLADGFIHFSSPSQVRETVARHFAGQTGLRLIGVDPETFGDELRWEPSRGGELFPHLYGAFSLDSVVSNDELPIGKNGRHIFPGEM